MDIGSFFDKKKSAEPIQILNEEENKKREFGKLLGGYLRDNVIDIDDYRFIMDSLKKGKSLTYFTRYKWIYNKVIKNLENERLEQFEKLYKYHFNKIFDVHDKSNVTE